MLWMHVFYTERGLAVHHHSSRGRGNPTSFLSDAFHHNVKKSQTEREQVLSAPAQAQKWEKKIITRQSLWFRAFKVCSEGGSSVQAGADTAASQLRPDLPCLPSPGQAANGEKGRESSCNTFLGVLPLHIPVYKEVKETALSPGAT